MNKLIIRMGVTFLMICLIVGVTHGIQVSESIEIDGTGTLLTMSSAPQASDCASGVGTQSYTRELDVTDDGTAMATYYELDGQTQRRNRYAITAINNNVSAGVQHSADAYGAKNIKTENFIEIDSAAFYTEFGVLGTGNFSASIRVADGHRVDDLTTTFADGDFDYAASVYEMHPPAGDNGDWLACSQLGDGPWPGWLDDEDGAVVFDDEEAGDGGCPV